MYALESKKGVVKSSATNLQATFHRHRRKIDQLRGQLEVLKNECEQTLILYHSFLKPKEKEAGNLIIQFILKMMTITQDPKALNKKERAIQQEILEESITMAFSLLPSNEINDDLKSLYKEIHGKGYDDDFYEAMSDLKDMFEEEGGISDIDLSSLNPSDSFQEMLAKLMQSVGSKMSEKQDIPPPPPPPPKQKSKKELLKEQKIRDLEALQNKGLNSIYKRLVKELHPDLEQNPEKRIEKVAIMKRLTVAYEKNDLISLLSLESEWLGGVDFASDSLSEENFKAYNGLLKDQIEDLKQELSMVLLHPRYMEIHRYAKDCPEKPLESVKSALSECDGIINEYSIRLKDLSGNNALKTLKKKLSYHDNNSENDDFPENFDFFSILNQLENDLLPTPPKTRKKRKTS